MEIKNVGFIKLINYLKKNVVFLYSFKIIEVNSLVFKIRF